MADKQWATGEIIWSVGEPPIPTYVGRVRRTLASFGAPRPVQIEVVAATQGSVSFGANVPVYKASSSGRWAILGAQRIALGQPELQTGDVFIATLVVDAVFAAQHLGAIKPDAGWNLVRSVTLEDGHRAFIYWYRVATSSPDLMAFRVNGIAANQFLSSAMLTLAVVRGTNADDPILATYGSIDVGTNTANVSRINPMPPVETGEALVFHVGWNNAYGDVNDLPTDVAQRAVAKDPWKLIADNLIYNGYGTTAETYRHVSVVHRSLPDRTKPAADEFTSAIRYLYGTPGSRGAVGVVLRPVNRPLEVAHIYPADGMTLDLTRPTTFSWSVTDKDGNVQKQFTFRRRWVSSGTPAGDSGSTEPDWTGNEIWNGSSWIRETVGVTVPRITSSNSWVTFPSGMWDNNSTYSWNVTVYDNENGAGGVMSDSWIVGCSTYSPVIAVTYPNSTVTDTAKPTVSWSTLFTGGGVGQATAHVIVTPRVLSNPVPVSVLDAVAEEFIIGSHQYVDLTDGLSNGLWTFSVEITDTKGRSSGWVGAVHDVDLPPIEQPTLSLVSESQTGRVVATVATDAGWWVRSCRFELQRLIGGVWTLVRGVVVPSARQGGGAVGSLFDYEVEDNIELKYRARVVVDFASSTFVSDWVEASVTSNFGTWWLKNLTNSSVNMPLFVEWQDTTVKRDRDEGRFKPLGRSTEVVVTGVTRGAEFELPILTRGDKEAAALERLLQSGSVLYVADDGGHAWHVIAVGPFDATTLATGERAHVPWRRYKVRFVEQVRP